MSVFKIVLSVILILSGYSEISATEEVAEHHPHRLHHNGIRKYRALSGVPVEGPLRFHPTPYGKNLELHSAGKIHCKVAGGKNPVAQWFWNVNEALPEGVTSINGTLQIAEAAKSHSGNYTCLVTDDDKQSINTTISLVVVVSPRVLEPQAGLEMHVTDGDDVWLHCRAAGDPVPTTLWDVNTTMLSVDLNDVASENSEDFETASKVLYANGSLLLRNVSSSSSAKYGCTAGSAAGMARNDVLLVVHPEGVLSTPSTGVAGKAVVISISVALAYMLLVLALMLYCRHRRERLARNRGDKIELEVAEGREKLVEDEETDKPKRNGVLHNGRLLTQDSGADNSEVSAASRASKRSGQFDHLSVPRTLLTETITLGRGEFGDVMLAKIDLNHLKKLKNKEITDSKSTPKLKPVLVKALSVKEENQLIEFRRNLDMFSRVRDECVVRVLGLCNEEDPHYLLLDHTDWGDFKQFLISTRSASGVPLSPVQAVVLAGHAARGAAAIAAHRHTHRDIAARNCVITSKLQLKLSFPAMTRGPYAQEYYKLHDQVIPLRWLPAEAVLESDYSSKSDVYMFAATVWEIYTKAELPFAKLNDNSVMERLKAGTLEWVTPDCMPEKLATLLKKCWSKSPTDRPQFDAIVAEMQAILEEIIKESEPASETVEVNDIENAEVV